jgi:hypothetical protein
MDKIMRKTIQESVDERKSLVDKHYRLIYQIRDDKVIYLIIMWIADRIMAG